MPKQSVPLYSVERVRATASTPHLSYGHGPLLTNVQVYTVFWGSAWTGSPLPAQVNQFFDFVLTSSLLDLLAEYSVPGKTIGHGARIGTKTLTTPILGTAVNDAQIQAAIKGWIANGMIAAQNANTLYFVYLPQGVTVTDSQGDVSCLQMCGYHWFIAGTSPQVYYAVMPFPGCGGCLGPLTQFEALTSTSSHELCEAITDPHPWTGWNDSSRGEIGDICAWNTQVIGGFTIQTEWSNSQNKCAYRPGDRLGMIVYGPQTNGSYVYSWGNGDMGQGAGNIGFRPVTMNGDGRTQILQLWDNGGRLAMIVYSPQPNGSYVSSWGNGNMGQGAGNIGFLPVTMNGDGKTQILQLWDNGGRLAMIVYSPQPNGSYVSSWDNGNMGQGAGNIGFLPVTMNGDGKTQILQLWDNGGRLAMIVYSPQPNGSYVSSWGNGNMGQGAGNISFLPVTMKGDGKTQILQLWNNGGRLAMIVYSPQPNGSYVYSWGNGDMGQGAGNIGFLPVTMKGDGKTQILQLWDNGGKLAMIVYSPQPNGSYVYSWGNGDMGQGAGNIGFLPVTMNGDAKTEILQLWDNA